MSEEKLSKGGIDLANARKMSTGKLLDRVASLKEGTTGSWAAKFELESRRNKWNVIRSWITIGISTAALIIAYFALDSRSEKSPKNNSAGPEESIASQGEDQEVMSEIKNPFELFLDNDIADAKNWPFISAENLGGINFFLKSKWIEGQMHFISKISPAPDKLVEARNAYESRYSQTKSFTVTFNDQDSFQILSKTIPLKAFLAVLDDQNKTVELEYKGAIACDSTTYKSLSSWNISWTANIFE